MLYPELKEAEPSIILELRDKRVKRGKVPKGSRRVISFPQLRANVHGLPKMPEVRNRKRRILYLVVKHW